VRLRENSFAQVSIGPGSNRHRDVRHSSNEPDSTKGRIMRYALVLNHAEPAPGDIPEEAIQETMAAFSRYADDLVSSGVLIGANILHPSSATTQVTLRDGTLKVQDGPFVESKEMLAGVFLIDVPDLDSALAWAEKCPVAQFGVIEVRPVANSIIDGQWTDPCRLETT
jgi:hypothetical protein